MSLLRQISPEVRNITQSHLVTLSGRVQDIKEELRQGIKKPFKDVLDLCWGDSHRAGVKPLSFVRQVLAACIYPQLAHSDKLPVDVRRRAQKLLSACDGGSLGSYTPTAGVLKIQKRISEFISRRDGGVPSFYDNIFMTAGAQRSIMQVLKLLVNREASPPIGVLTPCPSYSTANMALQAIGAAVVPYYLTEEQGWALHTDELHRALEYGKSISNPTSLYVINPGNPTGHVQNRSSMEEVIQFAAEQKLFIMADEVYQDGVFGEGCEFLSYKKVLSEMGPPYSNTVELASFHSASKGYMGECGLRGGYVELVNLDPTVMNYAYTIFSTDTCSPVVGQIALDLMGHPPQPGDPSYPLYKEETESIKATLVHNVNLIHNVLNNLPGFSCQPVNGGVFVFPRLHLPPKAIERAEELGMAPDVFYCTRLLEEAGLCVGPGSEHGQRDGTHHIRFCILTPEDIMKDVLQRLTSFHLHFMQEFS